MLFLYGGPFFYFHCWVSSPISLHLKKQTFVWTVHWFLHTSLLHLLYCFALTTIHEIYMLQVESNCWNLIILCVASMPVTLNLLLYELTVMQVLLMLVLKVLFMKSLCYMIHFFTHCLHHFFESLHSSHMLYYYHWQNCFMFSKSKL
jgi:hypothetical protein